MGLRFNRIQTHHSGRLIRALVPLLFLVACALTPSRAYAQGSDFLRCADVSFLNELESAGAVYRDDHALDDALHILQRRGLDAVRLRLWHTPPSGHDNLTDVLAAAQRAEALGLAVVLDFHFSDTWADPAHQTKPVACTVWLPTATPAHQTSPPYAPALHPVRGLFWLRISRYRPNAACFLVLR